MQRSLIAATLVACFAVSSARAQDLETICRRAGHPAVGGWSEFKLVGGRNDGATVRMSVVGSETRAGTSYIWLETDARGFQAGAGGGGGAGRTMEVVSKSLVPGVGPDWGAPQALIMKYGNAPAMEMPITHARNTGTPGSSAFRRCREATVVGWESVTVPAGTFRALHVRNPNHGGDVWADPDLPFGLVKATDLGGETREMVLVGHGRGARSAITEKPQPFDPAAFMRMMQPGRQGH